ncbi:Cleavage and polyadenylation specificity factor subunit 1, partial [Mucuna pruriens]
MAVLSIEGGDASRKRDSIILTFADAKISVLEYDDSIHGLRTSSLHCFEGPEWLHLKRGREQFARGPVVKVDPQGRCGGVLIYDLQMTILKATQVVQIISGLKIILSKCGGLAGFQTLKWRLTYLGVPLGGGSLAEQVILGINAEQTWDPTKGHYQIT